MQSRYPTAVEGGRPDSPITPAPARHAVIVTDLPTSDTITPEGKYPRHTLTLSQDATIDTDQLSVNVPGLKDA